jgi:hypothetical protein
MTTSRVVRLPVDAAQWRKVSPSWQEEEASELFGRGLVKSGQEERRRRFKLVKSGQEERRRRFKLVKSGQEERRRRFLLSWFNSESRGGDDSIERRRGGDDSIERRRGGDDSDLVLDRGICACFQEGLHCFVLVPNRSVVQSGPVFGLRFRE